MKRVYLLLAGSLLGLAVFSGLYALLSAYSTPTVFADPGLDAAVREALAYPPGAHIPRNELERLTELEAENRGIERLDGIESLPNLVRLDLRGNRVEDLSALGDNTRLQSLNLRDNNIADLGAVNLSALAGFPELRELNLRHNRGPAHPERPDEHARISDLGPLAALEELEVLDLRDNHIEDLSLLAELTRLRHLDLRDNRLSEDALTAVSGLERLRYLNLRNNNLRDLSGLGELSGLQYLNIHSNEGIESIVPIGRLTALEVLIMRNVPVGDDVQVLAELTGLRRLNVRNTGLRDLSVLADLMADGTLQDEPDSGTFAELDIRENPVSERGGSGYRILAEYWPAIARRHPQQLPE